MEQAKKRWRPSLTAYRELEKELAEAKETIRIQAIDIRHKDEDVKALKDENAALKKSNDSMEQGLKDHRAEISRLANALDACEVRVSYLQNRGLFARVFNIK